METLICQWMATNLAPNKSYYLLKQLEKSEKVRVICCMFMNKIWKFNCKSSNLVLILN